MIKEYINSIYLSFFASKARTTNVWAIIRACVASVAVMDPLSWHRLTTRPAMRLGVVITKMCHDCVGGCGSESVESQAKACTRAVGLNAMFRLHTDEI